MSAADRILDILETSGAEQYGDEAVSQLQHALQCAHLAESAGAPDPLVVAALGRAGQGPEGRSPGLDRYCPRIAASVRR